MTTLRLSFRAALLWLAICLLAVQLPAQPAAPIYGNETGVHAGILGLGGGLMTTSIMLDRRVSPLTDEDLAVLRIDNVWGIDRYSTRNFSWQAASLSDGVVISSVGSPFLLLAGQDGRDNFGRMSLIIFEGALLNTGLVNLTKVLVRRPRPYLFNETAPLQYKLRRDSRYSFFSGHTSTASYFSFVSAKMYNDIYPDSKLKPWVWGTAALLPAIAAYGRMRAGRHYFTDVLVGYAIGAVVGIVVPQLHK